MPSGVRGFISFHIATEEQYFTMCVSTLFHIERQRDISLSDLLRGIGPVALISDRFFDIIFILEDHNSRRGEYGITN